MKRRMRSGLAFVGACLIVGGAAEAQTVAVEAPASPVAIGTEAQVTIRLDNAPAVHGYSVVVSYDPAQLSYRGAVKATFLPAGSTVFFANVDTIAGRVTLDEAILGQGTQSGSGSLNVVRFMGRQVGATPLGIVSADVRNGENQQISVTTTGAMVQITGESGVDDSPNLPDRTGLEQNFPNPFNPSTNIGYAVGVVSSQSPVVSSVRLAVFDVNGHEVAVLVDERKEPGTYWVSWDARGMASGMYLCRLQYAGFQETIRMLLVR